MNACAINIDSMIVNIEFKSKSLFLKKRGNQWKNEIYKLPSTLQSAKNYQWQFYGDRFIPNRIDRTNIEHNLRFIEKKEIKDILRENLTPNYWNQSHFISLMNYTFNIRECRLLEFSKQLPTMQQLNLNPLQHTEELDWPCRPRTKPMAYTDATHDLPEFNVFFDYNLMDWSINDQIAVSFGQDIIIWKSRDDVTMIFNIKCPRSLAYSPNGKYLAIGCMDCQYPVLELWEVSSSSEFIVVDGKFFNKYNEAIRCIEWSKNSNEIVCGTNTGCIFVMSAPRLKTTHKLHKHKLPITIMRFSPKMRYLASGDIEGNITIYLCGTYEVYFHVRSKLNLRVTFDWHPWNGVDLAISENAPASIIILHVPSQQIVAFYQRYDNKLVIHSINFSKITGELLVSISKRGKNGSVQFMVLVMSSLSRIVDILDIPESGARFMMWSPDGTRLSTASMDESLSIWNFYPQLNKKTHKQKEAQQQQQKRSSITFGRQLMAWSLLK